MNHINNKIRVAIAETDVLKMAIKENWWSEEEVNEKLMGIIATLESVVKENQNLSVELKSLARKFQ